MRVNTTRSILLGALLTLVLSFVPYASYVTYPIRLFVTFIHEGGHALAGIVTGGSVLGLGVSPDASGVTLIRGGFGPLVNAAGYLGATFYGALLLSLLRRGVPSGKLLGLMAVSVALTLPLAFIGLIGTQGALFALFTGIPLTALLALAALKLPKAGQEMVVGFLGVQCVLNAFFDLRTLFLLSTLTNAQTDAMNMQRATLIPAAVWAVVWMGTALVILWAMVLRPLLQEAKRAL